MTFSSVAHTASNALVGSVRLAAATHWLCLASLAALGLMILHLRRVTKAHAVERNKERRLREELEAYARLDPALAPLTASGMDPVQAAATLGKRTCRTIAEQSAFRRVALVLRDVEGRLSCVAHVGVDDLTVRALNAWAVQVVAEERGTAVRTGQRPAVRSGVKAGTASFAISLGEWQQFDPEVSTWAASGKRERRRWRRAILAPIRLSTGRLMGVVAVCADGTRGERGSLEKAMGPIEALAARISSSMENEAMAERLLRAEKLAGLGQLAGGVAHALNNPLTAVLGFAELIAETTGEARVRKDAETIRAEALKMRDTVQRLTEFWRPAALADDAVDVGAMLAELATACEAKLSQRGVRLLIGEEMRNGASPSAPTVRGSRDRLCQVMEHLLNNAAQAIASVGKREDDDAEHAIRITLSHDSDTLHLIISDTGTGFEDPGRVFDPFYTTRGPEGGAGLGLSVCYGIVREHGGEISAFNLHPFGAAVVVELPLSKVVHRLSPAEPKARAAVSD